MTDDHDERRRAEDVYARLNEVEAALSAKVEEVRAELHDSHAEDSIMDRKIGGMTVAERLLLGAHDREQAKAEREAMRRQLDLVVDTIAGPVINTDVLGNEVRAGGLNEEVRELVQQARNGGIRVHLPASVVALLVALIGALGVIGAALLSRPPVP